MHSNYYYPASLWPWGKYLPVITIELICNHILPKM